MWQKTSLTYRTGAPFPVLASHTSTRPISLIQFKEGAQKCPTKSKNAEIFYTTLGKEILFWEIISSAFQSGLYPDPNSECGSRFKKKIKLRKDDDLSLSFNILFGKMEKLIRNTYPLLCLFNRLMSEIWKMRKIWKMQKIWKRCTWVAA
jgi:hypothetical protein